MKRKRHQGVTDQRKASLHRLKDAQALFQAGRWRGAMYMAGYAVECRLKYKLMQMWRCLTLTELESRLRRQGILSDPFTHNLLSLLRLSGGMERIQRNRKMWGKFLSTVNQWTPSWRYNPDLASRDRAEDFLEVADEAIRWIEHNL